MSDATLTVNHYYDNASFDRNSGTGTMTINANLNSANLYELSNNAATGYPKFGSNLGASTISRPA